MPLSLEAQPDVWAKPLPRFALAARRGLGLLAAAFGFVRFLYLRADFPNFSPWAIDQAKYTDEGWWASAAVRQRLSGYWNLPGDYNPGVALPVWPASLGVLFRLTGVSVVAARALEVSLSVATLGTVYLLVRRYTQTQNDWAPTVTALLVATSPFAFAYSRLAILDPCVVFEFSLLLLIASYAKERRSLALVGLACGIPVLLLTKTTAVVLLPAVAWIAWSAMENYPAKRRLLAMGLVVLFAALAVRGYVAYVFISGYGVDYRDFYDANSLDPIDWSGALATLRGILVSCIWTGRIVFPLAMIAGGLALVWLRELWRNPLFTACWLALGGQMTFLFATQGSYAPRYFLPMLVPFAIIIALAIDRSRECGGQAVYILSLITLATAVSMNIWAVAGFLVHRTTQFYDAAVAIQRIVKESPSSNDLVLGVSGSSLSLITGLPSISDVYGTVSLSEKVAIYRPGWFLAWNSVNASDLEALREYRLVEVARYPAFDDDERNLLILYQLVPPER